MATNTKEPNTQASGYTQGHSAHTLTTQQLRTVESSAAFLLPYIKNTDHILDLGCGPGTITAGLAKHANKGKTVGLDLSKEVLEKAKTFAGEQDIPIEGPGSLVFEHGNVLDGLPFPDNTFDIVFASIVFTYLPPPDQPLQALIEVRRVLKPGGIVATRDGTAQHFYPTSLNLDRLWGENFNRGMAKGKPPTDSTGAIMPAIFRKAGFDSDGGKVIIGAGTTVFAGKETRKRLGRRAAGQLAQGDPFRQSWLDAGIAEEEIQETLAAVEKWVETDDAWHVVVHSEMLAWK